MQAWLTQALKPSNHWKTLIDAALGLACAWGGGSNWHRTGVNVWWAVRWFQLMDRQWLVSV
jgi:hypothetical protein